MVKRLKLFLKISINVIGIPLKLYSYCIISYYHFVQFMILSFAMNKMKIKTKDLESPWITEGIKKSSLKKQRLHSKFLKKEMK